jgi:hypothetical protein
MILQCVHLQLVVNKTCAPTSTSVTALVRAGLGSSWLLWLSVAIKFQLQVEKYT